MVPASSKEFLDIQWKYRVWFTLKFVRDMIITYSQMHWTDKKLQQLNHLASLANLVSLAVWIQFFITNHISNQVMKHNYYFMLFSYIVIININIIHIIRIFNESLCIFIAIKTNFFTFSNQILIFCFIFIFNR